MVATESCWLLRVGDGCYSKVLVATGSFWLLQEGTGCNSKLLVAIFMLQEIVRLRSNKCSELNSDYISIPIIPIMHPGP